VKIRFATDDAERKTTEAKKKDERVNRQVHAIAGKDRKPPRRAKTDLMMTTTSVTNRGRKRRPAPLRTTQSVRV